MNIFYFAALIALVLALLERNHRRNLRLPHAPWGATDDRDLDRVRADLHEVGAGSDRPRRAPRPEKTNPAAAVCRPLAS